MDDDEMVTVEFVGGPVEGMTIRRPARLLPARKVVRGGNRPAGAYDLSRDPEATRTGPYRAEYVLREIGDRLEYVHDVTVLR